MPRRKGCHLDWNDRLTIEKMLREGYSKPQIARYLGVHHSTIYDECRRGETEVLNSDLTTRKVYSADVGRDYHLEKKKNMAKPLKIGKDHALADWLVKTIGKKRYSPSAACAMLGKTPETTFSVTLCRQTVYHYIEKGYLWPLTNEKLRYKGKKKQKYRRVRAAKAPRGDSIERRPESIGLRKEPGHWEMDSLKGKKGTKPTMLVLTERAARYELIIPMKDQTTASVVRALDQLEEKCGTERFRQIFRTITVDNGSEFSDCAGLERSCKDGTARTHLYYCHPRFPGERGSNEKQNQLIRWFFPKGTDFRQVPENEIRQVQDWINNYPRRILGWRTSADVFGEFLARI